MKTNKFDTIIPHHHIADHRRLSDPKNQRSLITSVHNKYKATHERPLSFANDYIMELVLSEKFIDSTQVSLVSNSH